jgi:serine/threonine protein kinase/Tol biopolymer transport system component
MSIEAGTKLGSYEITAAIGAGGMGEVYQAHDTKLGRDVAIKVLPEAFAHDPERLSRFQREAKMLASLNHPNIATIHGLEQSNGTSYLVMELVSGETLAERVKREGAVPIEEALAICKQIAEALEAAHEKGIIHRDLKPANVKVTPEGKVKVLDFGLAKAFSDDGVSSNPSESPTLSLAATMHGVILGTAAYMSPEQARGKAVDKRTDIWAFGCVLYELLTGQQAFGGEDITEILAAVVKTEPDWQAFPAATPVKIRDLMQRCLQKDRRQRFHDAADVRIEIEEALAAPLMTSPVAAIPRRTFRLWALMSGLACLIIAVITSIVTWNLKPSAPATPNPVTRLTVALPPGRELALVNSPPVAFSPDGRQLVYEGRNGGGALQLYLRFMDSLEGKPISGTEGASMPFFSPDGQWVGFFAEGKLKKVTITGGSSLVLCDAPNPRGGSWAPNDTVFFSAGPLQTLWQVSAKGGTAQVLTKLDRQKGEISHRWPQILPGGKAVLFTVWTGPGADERQVQLQILGSGERRVLVEGGHTGYYVGTGHLVYSRQGTLVAVPFDLARLEVGSSAPVAIAEGIKDVNEGAQYTISGNGSLAYVPGDYQSDSRLIWVDRSGKLEPLAAPPRPYSYPRISPDGQRVAVEIYGAKIEIWLYNFARGTLVRLTPEGSSQAPTWAPDGKRLAYRATRAGSRNILWRSVDGTGAEERLTTGEGNQTPNSWSPDGKMLAYDELGTAGIGVSVLSIEGERKARPFLQTRFSEEAPVFSPNGRWLAYVSNESGRNEIYVRPFPGPGEKFPISTEGGTEPLWARNGRELFYRSVDTDKMMAIEVQTEPSFRASAPRVLFQGRFAGAIDQHAGYDISPDGQRFLMLKANEQSQAPAQINVVLNWFEELKQKVPVGKK